ncbi:hypothetical protein [Phenylobacterium hankyongense]|nr:hypothetical protein [Phenylobacterium hankyongense]
MREHSALKPERPDPTEPGSGPLMFLTLLAAAGFAWGWVAQAALGSF